MRNGIITLFYRARAPGVSGPTAGLCKKSAITPDPTRFSLLKKLTIGTIVPLLATISLFGCQTSAGQSNAWQSPKTKATRKSEPRPSWPMMLTIPSGTALLVSLNSTLRTDREMTGDGIVARLYHAVRVNQMTVLPAGTTVRGRLLLVAEPHNILGRAQMTLVFDRLVDPSGRIHLISTAPIVFVGECDKTSDEIKVSSRGSTRFVSDAFSGNKPRASGAVVGTVAYSAGSAIAFATESRQIELPSNQHFVVELEAPLRISVTQLTASR